MHESISLFELNSRISRVLTSATGTQNIWVTAELSDVAVRRGHCYMELLQKDDNGTQVAKARGVIWASIYGQLSREFMAATGQPFATGIKLMVKASATMHPVFGLSLVITGLDPNYTMGDLLRRRREIIDRLTREGVIDMNRELQWPAVPQRIAVISAPGAAGYGDFMNQLLHNSSRLRFMTRLFPAIMQGERAAASIIESLNEISAGGDGWDCVVIIRGGGATSDLQCFEDYNLALNIAQFEIPIIIGIGHERDVTLLDYVANMRVKTPTAAAEWLISLGEKALAGLDAMAQLIFTTASDIIAGCKEQLSYYSGVLPVLPHDVIGRASLRLNRAVALLSGISSSRLSPARSRLDVLASNVVTVSTQAVARNRDRLIAAEQLLAALSPQAVLDRGYSITRVNGRVVTNMGQVSAGDIIETTLASGTMRSKKI